MLYTKDVTNASWSASATNEKLDDGVAACDEIIQSGLFNLSDDYLRKFYPNNGPHIRDFIYTMPYTASKQDGMTYARFRTWRKGDSDGKGVPDCMGLSWPSQWAGILP